MKKFKAWLRRVLSSDYYIDVCLQDELNICKSNYATALEVIKELKEEVTRLKK